MGFVGKKKKRQQIVKETNWTIWFLIFYILKIFTSSIDTCYNYRLSNQHMHEYTHENRHSGHYLLHTRLETLHNRSLNNSRVERMTVLTIETHISSPGPHIHISARSGNWTRTPRPRTSVINSPPYHSSSPWLHSPAMTEMLLTADNRSTDQAGCPPD